MNTLFYIGFSCFVLALGLWTSIEDEKILKATGEQYDGRRLDMAAGILLVVGSFIPLINIFLLIITLIYRSEGNSRVRTI